MKIEKNEHGVTFWGDNKKWVIDASTVLDDGEVTIDTSGFEIEYDSREQKMILQLKEN